MRARVALRSVLLSALAATLVLSASVASADNLVNDVRATGNATLEFGGSTAIRYGIVPTSGDGQPGCNAADGTPATVTIIAPSQVSASPSSLTFTACRVPQWITFTATALGDYPISAAVSDAGPGSYHTAPASFTLHVVDTTPPDTTITTGPRGLSPTSSASFGFTGSDIATATPGFRFECQLDGGGYWPCASPHALVGLADGPHTFQVRAIDAVGNTDPTAASFSWIVDTTAPVPSITARPPALSASPSATFTFMGTDNVTPAAVLRFDCELDAAGYAPCTSPQTYTALPDGDHVFRVRVTDEVGHQGTATHAWTVDTTAPDTTITAAPPAVSARTSVAFGFTGDDTVTPPAGLGFECQLDDGPYAACTSPMSYPGLAVGPHRFRVRAVDGAGHRDPTPAEVTWDINYRFVGFKPPVPNPPEVTTVTSGSTALIRWRLVLDGSPVRDLGVVEWIGSRRVRCGEFTFRPPEPSRGAGAGPLLRYDDARDRFVYAWPAPTMGAKGPRARCYVVGLVLDDGTTHHVNVKVVRAPGGASPDSSAPRGAASVR